MVIYEFTIIFKVFVIVVILESVGCGDVAEMYGCGFGFNIKKKFFF